MMLKKIDIYIYIIYIFVIDMFIIIAIVIPLAD